MSGGVCDLPGERCFHPISCEERGCVRQRPAPKPKPAALSPQALPAPGEVELVASALCRAAGMDPKGGARSGYSWINHEADARTLLASLATVAAANDEGVARIIDPGAWMDHAQFSRKAQQDAERSRVAGWLDAAEKAVAPSLAKAAAIRLLSQGEGKARSEGWTEKGHEWLDAGAPLPTSRKDSAS